MQLITKHQNKEFWLFKYGKDSINKLEFKNEPFVCIIRNKRRWFWNKIFFNKLLKTGCKYFTFWWYSTNKIHCLIDHLFISKFYPSYIVPDEEFIMTMGHARWSIKYLMFFSIYCTDFDNYIFNKYLFIQIDWEFTVDELEKVIKKQFK